MKPIWLLMTTWIVPPVRYPGSCARFKTSATIPCPANAASPWSSTGRTRFQAAGPWPARRSCFARTTPSTTGSTASRCDGFDGDLDRRPRGRVSVLRIARAPWWYFTSPSSAGKSGWTDALEAGEDALGRVADDVGEDVQPPAVRHADRRPRRCPARPRPRRAGRAAGSPSRSLRRSSGAGRGTSCRGSARTPRPRSA